LSSQTEVDQAMAQKGQASAYACTILLLYSQNFIEMNAEGPC